MLGGMGKRVAVLAVLGFLACGGDPKVQDDAPLPGATCGDGLVEDTEQCDLGSENGMAGGSCSASCTFACVDAATDCGEPPACQAASCSMNACVFAADATKNGTSCGTDKVCLGGTCLSITCGDGIVGPGEDCDFGANNGPNSGCELDCSFSCELGATTCDDSDPCNGVESCAAVTTPGAGQKCMPGTPQGDGASCGTGMVCVNAACTAAVCGDSYTTSPEECDDANQVTGDGCEPGTCEYSCVSSDPTRNCTPADACAGQGTCNDTTHRCSAGTPLGNNTPCGTGGYCQTGVCAQPMCGDGTRTPNEECDNGLLNGSSGNGCRADCTWVCDDSPATQCGTAAACQQWTCTAAHTCQSVANTAANGTTCGSGLVCTNGSCASPSAVCGNGTIETGEQCDFGTGNGPNTGCETNCTFSCTTAPNSCDDGNACDGLETCVAVTNPGAGRRCVAGTPLMNGTTCGTGSICLSQTCTLSTCGDGYLDTGGGETCEPPNSATCDDVCHTIVCGDGVRKGTEQCDDGNLTRIDGCDPSCKFEQTHRMNTLQVQFGTSMTYCPKNAMGGGIVGSTPRTQIADAINLGVNDGSITVMFHALGLDDLSGTNDPALNLAILGGVPAAGTNYNGASDLDWWYTTDANTLDANRMPISLVPATIVAKALNAGPSSFAFTVSFVGVAVTMNMFDTTIRATLGAATTPLMSSGTTPGHLASEHLDPALTSFGTATAGEICGKTTAASLASVLVPSALVGNTVCAENYSTSNTLLDVFIGGCKTFGFIRQIDKTQPDAARTPGDVYVFTANAARSVTACTKNGQPAVLSECLQNAAYTSYYKFTTDRVIAK